MTMLRRTCAPTDLELRGGDGRTVCGLAVPWDSPTTIRDPSGTYTELFRAGSFARTLAERGAARVKVHAMHDTRALPLGRAHVLREDPSGLYCELRVSATQAGDEALELVRDGALDSLSIGFVPVRHRRGDDGLVERTEVKLYEVSLVAYPAYESARVTAVRHDLIPGGETPHLRDIRARHAQRRAHLDLLEMI